MDKPTEKQLNYIRDIREHSILPLPTFNGTTKQEATEWISKYHKYAYESDWAIVNGYE